MTRICCIDVKFKVNNLKISRDTTMLLAIGHDGEVKYW